MGSRIGFVASEKGAGKECDVGLGLRMQANDKKSFSRKKMMMPHHDEDDDDGDDDDKSPLLNRGFGEEGCGGLGCGSGNGNGGTTTGHGENDTGPSLFCNTSNNNNSQVGSMADIYDVVGSDSGSLLPKTMLLPNSETFSYNSSGKVIYIFLIWVIF